MTRKAIVETIAEAPKVTSPGQVELVLISPGWGSSGYYSQQVLENAAKDRVWGEGTHCFFDHPSESELSDRPERSVRDLAMVLSEDARSVEGVGLVAKAKVIGPYRELITDPVFVEAVGISVRAFGDATIGEAEGRKGTIITNVIEGQSVDLVTRAGRGGRILSVLESARREIHEASAEQTRDRLYDVVRYAYGDSANEVYAWVRDFDPDARLVWFDVNGGDKQGMWQQAYVLDADDIPTLTGDPIEVAVRTEYVPIKPPVNPAGSTTQESQEEDTMPQIEESRLAQLEEAAGRVQTLESERDAARTERDTALAETANLRARETARPSVTQAVSRSSLPARRQARLIESILRDVTPQTTPEAVAEATASAVAEEEAEIAELAESLGVGKPRGFGQSAQESAGYSVEDFDAAFNASQEG